MAVTACTGAVVQEPGFITYLLNPDLDHDCYFVVKTPNLRTERIGVVKKMLMAHSAVLRAELQESELAMEGDVPVDDLFPDTIRNLLKYVYGYDTVATLGFDDADNLLYAAEKYMMEPLKNKLALRLMGLLTSENICSLLNNPACFRHLELQSAITMILQFETDKVLASPQFLDLSSDAFLKILEQDPLAVKEIEIWRAAVKWAKHKAVCEDEPQLRQHLSNQLKHIRFLTFTSENLCKEVIPTGVLTYPEIRTVCSYIWDKEMQPQLTDICDKTEPRRSPIGLVTKVLIAKFPVLLLEDMSGTIYSFIYTRRYGIELLAFVFKAAEQPYEEGGENYRCRCKITITKYRNNERVAVEQPVSVVWSQGVVCEREFKIPITVNGKNVRLEPNSQYRIKVRFSDEVMSYSCLVSNNCSKYSNEHFTVNFMRNEGDNDYYESFINKVEYRTVTNR